MKPLSRRKLKKNSNSTSLPSGSLWYINDSQQVITQALGPHDPWHCSSVSRRFQSFKYFEILLHCVLDSSSNIANYWSLCLLHKKCEIDRKIPLRLALPRDRLHRAHDLRD